MFSKFCNENQGIYFIFTFIFYNFNVSARNTFCKDIGFIMPTSSGPEDIALAFLFRFTIVFLVPVPSLSGDEGFDPAFPLLSLLFALLSSFLGSCSLSLSKDFSLTHVSSRLLTIFLRVQYYLLFFFHSISANFSM